MEVLEVMGRAHGDIGRSPGLGYKKGRREALAPQGLSCLPEDGRVDVARVLSRDTVQQGELAAGRLAVREDVVFECRADREPELNIAERRVVDGALHAGRPMWTEAADDQQATAE